MHLEMFFNELSLAPLAADIPSAQERARMFVMTIREASALGVKRILRLPENFFAQPIAPSYFWQQWLGDNRVDYEARRYFRSIMTKAPFLNDVPGMKSHWAEIDCYWKTRSALGFKAAYVADGLSLSLYSSPEWDSSSIICDIHEIIEDDLSCRSEAIHHASLAQHLGSQSDWIQSRIQTTVTDGKNLWKNIRDFFPCLEFCQVVEHQMAILPQESLASIVRGLFNLNKYCLYWESGPFNPDTIECVVSPESESTLNLFADERTMLCPDGLKRVFSWHAKLGRWRIYFDMAANPGRLLIGYVGKHLRTAMFR
jgi:hypothetical protein